MPLPMKLIFPVRPKGARALALSGIKIVERCHVGEFAEQSLNEGIERVQEARLRKKAVLTPYELYVFGMRLLSSSYVEAHLIGMDLCDEAKALDPEAVKLADRNIRREAEGWPIEPP
jgi:hypothetical protein